MGILAAPVGHKEGVHCSNDPAKLQQHEEQLSAEIQIRESAKLNDEAQNHDKIDTVRENDRERAVLGPELQKDVPDLGSKDQILQQTQVQEVLDSDAAPRREESQDGTAVPAEKDRNKPEESKSHAVETSLQPDATPDPVAGPPHPEHREDDQPDAPTGQKVEPQVIKHKKVRIVADFKSNSRMTGNNS